MNFKEYKELFEKFECNYCTKKFNGFGCEKHYINLHNFYYFFIYNEYQYIFYYDFGIELIIKVSKEKSLNACDNNISFKVVFSMNLEDIKIDSLLELQNFIIRKYIDNLIFQ